MSSLSLSFRKTARHPLASKRFMMIFRDTNEDIHEVFELPTRYDALLPIGRGANGYVCSARDDEKVELFTANPPEEWLDASLTSEERQEIYETHTSVAVKKLRQLFERRQPRMWLCAIREIQLMMAFKHDNVMSATDFFIPLGECETMTYDSVQRLRQDFDSVYVVMKKMDYTLREVLESTTCVSSNGGDMEPLHPLPREYRMFILYQLLRGVGYMHLCQVMHRDIKPENVMLDRNYNTCVCDFGQGRDTVAGGSAVHETFLDNCTQWYAAPETLTLAVLSSTTGWIDSSTFHGADVWSIGCIAAEMLIGRPLFHTTFFSGVGQLHAIMDVLGEITDDHLEDIVRHRGDDTRDIFRAVLRHERQRFVDKPSRLRGLLKSPFGDEDKEEVELIEQLLVYNPSKRMKIQDALQSPYFMKEGYNPVIDVDDTATLVQAVQKTEILDAENGREFLWSLFLQRHPDVRKLIAALHAGQSGYEYLSSSAEHTMDNSTTACPATSVGKGNDLKCTTVSVEAETDIVNEMRSEEKKKKRKMNKRVR